MITTLTWIILLHGYRERRTKGKNSASNQQQRKRNTASINPEVTVLLAVLLLLQQFSVFIFWDYSGFIPHKVIQGYNQLWGRGQTGVTTDHWDMSLTVLDSYSRTRKVMIKSLNVHRLGNTQHMDLVTELMKIIELIHFLWSCNIFDKDMSGLT